MRNNEIRETVILMALLIVVSVGVHFASKHNGRIEMCQELGRYYTYNDKCLTCEETGRRYIDGKCVLPDTSTKNNLNNIDFKNSVRDKNSPIP